MIGRALRGFDEFVAPASLRLLGENPVLLTFLFHAILEDGDVRPSLTMDKSLIITTSDFRCFVDYFLSAGYVFVTPDEVAGGLPKGGRFVLSTFDDGYFNNTLALPILEEFSVPSAFYISTDHIRTGDSYWWDAWFRRRTSEGIPAEGAVEEMASLKALTHDGIRRRLIDRIGSDALRPAGDHDRPMTISELKEFAAHPRVCIGNHTVHHAILTNYDHDGLREELKGAQDALEEWTGRAPLSVSYPNGNYSPEVVAAAVDCGLSVGITTIEDQNPLPLMGNAMLRLNRFRFDCRAASTRKLAVYRNQHSAGRVARRLRRGRSA
jgi:peptidoglycan/xylan/chitin deacetylase (PgdA/CDA1 family)